MTATQVIDGSRHATGTRLALVSADGDASRVGLLEAPAFQRPAGPLRSRELYAAAHVIPRPTGENVPGAPADIDWDATLDYRRQLWSWGLGVADAMDTAQRNMGLDAAATRELIARSAAAAREAGGSIAVGVNTDSRTEEVLTLDEIEHAYLDQLEFAEAQGALPVIMASRHLARAAQSPADYLRVYNRVLGAVSSKAVLHWLGTAFDPSLRGYFGADAWQQASDLVIALVEEHADKVSGIKMSLLDADAERAVRARLPEGVTMFTGDDFNYVELIEDDAKGIHSDALLGAFSVLAPNASAAVQALDAGDPAEFRRILEPTQELSRQVFATPTFYYKTGVAFLSWLNGHQDAFQMVGGLHAARSLPHLSRIVELANASGALERPELAADRWHSMLRLNGVDA
ncbi:dihydrodipicolinate synthase family protein [Pseudoclavibacter sp. RFBA6]|uniref:dihydrodipicolinate synthase family protein n=1 Tax=Pseudoclavibacter sp. RFBA6 TaxID=2080573 RepID=UPI000CE725DE|nr:dihydrodipicolinate synthase family protein [Pseudoclavibacter sp. RFBA6]PPG43874.1 dihydrodipicolinate synthase family protein [Pseudoclavibacter sp. RFBA6]